MQEGLFAQKSADFLSKHRQDLEGVADQTVVGDREDWGVLVLIDRNYILRAGHAGEMLHGAADAARDIQCGTHSLAGLSYLLGVCAPSCVDDGAGRAHGATEGFGKLLDQMEVLGGL